MTPDLLDKLARVSGLAHEVAQRHVKAADWVEKDRARLDKVLEWVDNVDLEGFTGDRAALELEVRRLVERGYRLARDRWALARDQWIEEVIIEGHEQNARMIELLEEIRDAVISD